MNGTGFFTYQPADSPIHALSPVTKLVCGAALVLVTFALPGWGGLLVTLGLAVLSAFVGGVGRSVVRTAATVLAPLAVGLVVLRGLFTPVGRVPLATLGPLTVWQGGLVLGLRTLVILAAFVVVALTFVATTHPKRLTTALIERGVPENVSYVFLASLQLVPDLQARARRILDAQQSRGLDVSGGLTDRFRAFVALASPLLIGALVSAQTRSLALEARGFSRQGPRTHLYQVSEPPAERLLQAFAVVGVLVTAGWRVLA